MRPLTDTVPKPLVRLMDRTLIDRVLDRIVEAGIPRAVVNVHYKAELIEAHLSGRTTPHLAFSDEREALLDTGGGVRKALPLLGPEPFLVHNSDSVWIESGVSNLRRMTAAWRDGDMDILLLLADRETCLGYTGRGDFSLDADGRVARPLPNQSVPYVFAGASIAHPRIFSDSPEGPFSLNLIWDKAIAAGRLSAIVLDGTWMHVGDPEALADAEWRLREDTARVG
jgi:MurNAc alpha-1-phosphate uridylyltransferase